MVSIRPATADDAEMVDAIAQSAFAHYTARIGRPPIPMSVDYAAAIEAGKVWVAGDRRTTGDAADDRSTAGFVLLEDQDDSLLLDVIAVAPAAQGSGVGAALLAFVDAEAHARGYSRITLYTNVKMTENLAYYPRHGYVETGRESVGPFHRVHFLKHLTAPTDR